MQSTPNTIKRLLQHARAVTWAWRRAGAAMMQWGEQAVGAGVTAIPSGCEDLDRALGVGGLPRGRIIEVLGGAASGKTTLALGVIAQAQKLGGSCAFVDAEHALDAAYARAVGVDPAGLWVSRPDTGEEALAICERLARSRGIDLIVLDSAAALVPSVEREAPLAATHGGLQPRLVRVGMRTLAGIVHATNSTVIVTNQLRYGRAGGAAPVESGAGGDAVKFYASVRIEVRRKALLEHGHAIVGHRSRLTIIKNKLSFAPREVEVDILFGRGMVTSTDEQLS